MISRTIRRFFLALFTLIALTHGANALPQTFVQEGLVTGGNGQPLQGLHRVEIQLFSAAQGGNLLYEEAHAAVLFVNGYYAISVGSEAALPATIFTQSELFSFQGRRSATRTGSTPCGRRESADVATNVIGDVRRHCECKRGGGPDAAGKWVGSHWFTWTGRAEVLWDQLTRWTSWRTRCKDHAVRRDLKANEVRKDGRAAGGDGSELTRYAPN